jgi:hypothetical protein
MTRNYDTTNGQPFWSISRMDFHYDPISGQPELQVTEQLCLRSSDDVAYPLDAKENSFEFPINLNDPVPVQMYDPRTGEPIVGQTASFAEIFALVYSVAQQYRVLQGM